MPTVIHLAILSLERVTLLRQRVRSPPGPHLGFLLTNPHARLGPIFLSRFLLDICSLSFTDPRSHIGIPGVDSITSVSSFEMYNIHLNVSRVLGNPNAIGPEASLDIESYNVHSYDSDIDDVGSDNWIQEDCGEQPLGEGGGANHDSGDVR